MFLRLSIALAMLSSAALAQEATAPAPPQPARVTDQVIVTAPSVDVVRAFVSKVSVPASEGLLARWDRKVCPGVSGMEEKQAEIVNDRLAMVAYRVGLDVGEPGCLPNIFINFTRDGVGLSRKFVDDNPDFFDKYDESGGTLGRRALKDFTSKPRPVSWWHVTRTVTADGQLVRPGDTITVRSAGRIARNTRQDLDRTVVIIDAEQVGIVQFEALADYIAMVSLAQIDSDVDVSSYPSILNIFADRKAGKVPATSLTTWDISFLQGLYGARRDRVDARRQQADIAKRMMEGGKAEDEPAGR